MTKALPTQDQVEALYGLVFGLSDDARPGYGLVDEQDQTPGLVVSFYTAAAQESFDRAVKALPEKHLIKSVPMSTRVIAPPVKL